ncbi:hypothetical protein [Desertivibrio insolitus]|uniref:hypothetical protein n=1 Tax=Herbiconiux sp. SYSU D00978 TaxID=2812562 RepID=UPI001A9752B1|nr:hypothetical protein [Herbiconiux sp. SYSU D00978]
MGEDAEPARFLDEIPSGSQASFRVRTASGATYELDLRAQTARRLRWDGERLEMPSDGLRHDGEVLPLLRFERCRVGEHLVLLLAGVSDDPRIMFTVRRTTPVVSILEISHR